MKPPTEPITAARTTSSPLASLDETLQRIFATTPQETRLQKARGIMGDELRDMSDEELEVHLTQFQHLIDKWLDAYEKQQFDGLTLRELLGQG